MLEKTQRQNFFVVVVHEMKQDEDSKRSRTGRSSEESEVTRLRSVKMELFRLFFVHLTLKKNRLGVNPDLRG